ncbi:uncharacterized protein BDZ99DRAFT_425309 [Mytilinidion resinicola]|uniref:Zn(2)-C6 fungal-type domain-containing protein n=1 Tax=Mytilinidion resinicola TaxID=574789 RepID=A0A6A6Y7M2_9PEZI|nr:uncharacterized protein BDZ99DRAFT_425309 [Mytilinidion resinicola]KAF2804548.1 hypothetical protein BDZ99DRAFT_425309 [Mytilinidion resinicola]
MDGSEPKRRKVRKGTQNCWECRRRKVRCIFAATEAVCENCRRRGTACLSQEYPDEPMPSAGSIPVETRLGRVEQLVERLYEELSRALTAAWPSQRDIDIICTLPVGLSAHLHGGICTPYSSSMRWDPPSPREMLKLPPPGSHPVLIARKLLVLGTFLQGVLPSAIQELTDLGSSYHDVMSHVVESAIRLVTTNEDLIRSVEGLECIMIEAEYQNYAGNLHRAWMAMRRATTVAQMMALHRGLNSPSLKILTQEMRAIFNPDQICFRLVEMDRYLSLMLGLPCTSLEARFASSESLKGCQPIDRMQRIHCTMADRILQRNENNLSETHDIDTLLQKAAAEMPPQWWLIPDLSASNMGGTEVLHETIRLMDQFSHYHLLIRLHLPYMLRSSPDHRYDHSKITAVNVSRETLARFVAFRTSNPAHFYCRGTDFLAFISTTVLCLAHLESRGRRQGLALNSNPGAVFSFLAHSRPSDRGIMERTLEIIESMARAGTDAIASKIARILRPLLAIEANAVSGTSYSINSSTGDEEELEYHGKLSNGGKGLHVHIPYFGTINFERGAISKSFPVGAGVAGVEDDDWDLQGVDVALFDSLFRGTTIPDAVEEEAWTQWAGNG